MMPVINLTWSPSAITPLLVDLLVHNADTKRAMAMPVRAATTSYVEGAGMSAVSMITRTPGSK